MLVGFQPNFGQSDISHYRLVQELMTDKPIHFKDLDGICFSRVIWGHGAHVLYYDTLVVMRRLVGDFAHEFIQTAFNLSYPIEFKQVNQPHSYDADNSNNGIFSENKMNKHTLLNQSLNLNHNKFPKKYGYLNIVYYTRGDSGRGRSIQNEFILVNELKSYGARVVFCCDFKHTSLENQLSYALYADVVRLYNKRD
jgi:hypothetical protein